MATATEARDDHRYAYRAAARGPRSGGTGRAPRGLLRFPRQTKQVGARFPQRDPHGLARGDVELALWELVGNAAPVAPTSRVRRTAQWHLEYEAWTYRRLEELEGVDGWADGRSVTAGWDDSTVARGQRESTESGGAVLRGICAIGGSEALALDRRGWALRHRNGPGRAAAPPAAAPRGGHTGF
jgi:hypothetical protein